MAYWTKIPEIPMLHEFNNIIAQLFPQFLPEMVFSFWYITLFLKVLVFTSFKNSPDEHILSVLTIFTISFHVTYCKWVCLCYPQETEGGSCRCHTRKQAMWRDENEILVQSDFINLDQTSQSIMPGRSLSAYLKQYNLGKGF